MPQHEKEKYLFESMQNDNISMSTDERRMHETTQVIFSAFQKSTLQTRTELQQLWEKHKETVNNVSVVRLCVYVVRVCMWVICRSVSSVAGNTISQVLRG